MTIENTSTRDPIAHLVGALGRAERYIGEMEKAGQAQLVRSEMIPTDRRSIADAELAELGFTLGGAAEGDPLFPYARLPDGWTKKATGHDMWSEIVDETGVIRFEIFYKAAFYDRSAFMRRA